MPSLAVATPAASFGSAALPPAAAVLLAAPFAARFAGMLDAVPGAAAGGGAAAVTSCGLQPAGTQAVTVDAGGDSGVAAATPHPRGAIPALTGGSGEVARTAQTRSPSRRPSDAEPDAGSAAVVAAASWPAGIALASAFPLAIVAPVVTGQAPPPATVSDLIASHGEGGSGMSAAAPAGGHPGALPGGGTVGSGIAAPVIQPAAVQTGADGGVPSAGARLAAMAPPGTATAMRKGGTGCAAAADMPATGTAAPSAGNAGPAPQANPAAATAPVSAAADAGSSCAPAGSSGRHRSAPDSDASRPAAIGGTPENSAGQHPGAVSAPLPETPLPAPALSAGATPAAAAPATTAPAASSAAPAPAQQAMHALVSLGSSQGTHHVTVQLDPQELGRLQIRIEQPQDGPARVALTAERPGTLDLLVRDQAQLRHALDQAGVPAEGRALTFHLAASAPDPLADASRTALASGTSGSAAGDLTGGGRGGAQQGPQRDGASAGQPRMTGAAADPPADIPRAAPWLRAGIDITA